MPQLFKILKKDGRNAGTYVTQKVPETREEAILYGTETYWPGTVCPECQDYDGVLPFYYVKSGARHCCIIKDAENAWQEAKANDEPLSAAEAHERSMDYYWIRVMFSKCGHTGKATLKGTCYECAHDRANSPRQLAIQAGETWYMPTEPCPKCGKVARKRVATGSCESCEELRHPGKTIPIYKQTPDAIIDLETAVAGGLKYYRTGDPCQYGHKGWRYVSTRACMTCLGRDDHE